VVVAMCAPMAAVALLPVTAFAGFVASTVAVWLGSVAGAVVLLSVVFVVGYLIATVLFDYGSRPADSGWRRFLPHGVTAGVVAAGLTEIISGSRAPDPVIALWFLALAWLVVLSAHVHERWSAVDRAVWFAGPIVTIAVIVVVWTSGFFALRFERSVDALDVYVSRLEAGQQFVPRTHVGWFTVLSVREVPGCRAAFEITGWHEGDDRLIAECPNGAAARPDLEHLAGDWYEYVDRPGP
jgi:hypothetical protein